MRVEARTAAATPTRREFLRAVAVAGTGSALSGCVPPAGTPARYDDGSASIPGGLSGDPETVIVVGAGWAGLTAANALSAAGVDCVVLEATDRIGGRAHTVDVGGVPTDLGCSWISEPYGNPLARYASQAGVATRNADLLPDATTFRMFDAVSDRELDGLERFVALGHAFRFFAGESRRIARHLGPDASVRDAAVRFLDREGFAGATRRRVEFGMRLLSELPENVAWDRLSLHEWVTRDLEYLGTGLGEWPVGGYGRLVAAMSDQLDVRLGYAVRSIDRRGDGVRVRVDTPDGRLAELHGSHVVVTTSLGVLKAGGVHFEPGLPAAKAAAIDRLGFGAIEKVALTFDEPFWSDAWHSHILHIAGGALFELPMWVDVARISGAPSLVVFSVGEDAERLGGLGPEGSAELALARLGGILGREVPRPAAWAVSDWQGNPYCRGGYTTILAGGTADDIDVLAAPVDGRLLFAGEATDRNRYAHADGAMRSGIREAKRLLRQPEVELTAR